MCRSVCLSVRFHSRKRQPGERDRGDGIRGWNGRCEDGSTRWSGSCRTDSPPHICAAYRLSSSRCAKICPRITLIDANHRGEPCPKRSESRRLLNRRFSGSLLAFIRVIRGLNVFGCGGAARRLRRLLPSSSNRANAIRPAPLSSVQEPTAQRRAINLRSLRRCMKASPAIASAPPMYVLGSGAAAVTVSTTSLPLPPV